MKYCKDCKHFRPAVGGLNETEYAKCRYNLAVSPVTGRAEIKTQTSEFCITLRQSKAQADCGCEARFFECGHFLDDGEGEACGDEGRLCEICLADCEKEHAWMRGQSKGACTGVMSEQDKQDLRDAGRGHLV